MYFFSLGGVVGFPDEFGAINFSVRPEEAFVVTRGVHLLGPGENLGQLFGGQFLGGFPAANKDVAAVSVGFVVLPLLDRDDVIEAAAPGPFIDFPLAMFAEDEAAVGKTFSSSGAASGLESMAM
jgi:hypothetical protein